MAGPPPPQRGTPYSVDLPLEAADTATLTQGANTYFGETVREYAAKLFSQAKSIERMEHAGDGQPEITAAHIEEAKWVLVRRRRLEARDAGKAARAQLGQIAAAFAVGIGASAYKEWWGAVLVIVSALGAAWLWAYQQDLQREP